MNEGIKNELGKRGADIVRFVDISDFHEKHTLNFDKAILFCMVLSKKFILDMYNNLPVEEDEFLWKEKQVEELADWLADDLRKKGHPAHSQSEKSNMHNSYIESAYINPNLQQGISVFPQKAIARIAGLGFIGKNNLLVTNEYGCALTICSVLTDAPVQAEVYPAISSKCGSCDACVKICPTNAIYGNEWTQTGGRESLIDVSACCCALKCMTACPWTLRYARKGKPGIG